ncbi:hypothetical protein M406DRAFT_330049 [Cryphonectria parasitica EP155]|uniref:Alkali metal cation/H+ antiporter Nha1 C-terminal domain-containing protein n=1 Tax=Cryphonectria parasitica (strain ATCC 38755 / EP155) TaxID=660469 RepID=A0A9P4Y4B7_CRYP1|nr:uncharacterized protein M406DRAFT_330049 [Cryphonectria parasitica EP155]KAF3766214.1 hypothetical protein M406DRAFT_330049 [Cryphonectria parasitica EP155]
MGAYQLSKCRYLRSTLQQPQSSRRVNDDKRQADIEAKIRDDMEKAMRKQLEAMREAQEFANAELTRAAQAYLEARDLSLPRYGPSRTSTRQAAQTERLAQRSTQQPTQRSSRRSTKRTFGRVNDEPLRNRLSCHSLTSTERENIKIVIIEEGIVRVIGVTSTYNSGPYTRSVQGLVVWGVKGVFSTLYQLFVNPTFLDSSFLSRERLTKIEVLWERMSTCCLRLSFRSQSLTSRPFGLATFRMARRVEPRLSTGSEVKRVRWTISEDQTDDCMVVKRRRLAFMNPHGKSLSHVSARILVPRVIAEAAPSSDAEEADLIRKPSLKPRPTRPQMNDRVPMLPPGRLPPRAIPHGRSPFAPPPVNKRQAFMPLPSINSSRARRRQAGDNGRGTHDELKDLLGLWRGDKMQKRKEKQTSERRHEPARAYQFGRTIIIEDADGEVIKEYELPLQQKPENQPSQLSRDEGLHLSVGDTRSPEPYLDGKMRSARNPFEQSTTGRLRKISNLPAATQYLQKMRQTLAKYPNMAQNQQLLQHLQQLSAAQQTCTIYMRPGQDGGES